MRRFLASQSISSYSANISEFDMCHSVDATFVCFNIDLDIGQTNHQEAYDAFAYEDESDQSQIDEEENLPYKLNGMYESESAGSA